MRDRAFGILAVALALALAACGRAAAMAPEEGLKVELEASGLPEGGEAAAFGAFTVEVRLADSSAGSRYLSGLAGLMVDLSYDPEALSVTEARFTAGEGYIHSINSAYEDAGGACVRLVFVSAAAGGMEPGDAIMAVEFQALGSADGAIPAPVSASIREAYLREGGSFEAIPALEGGALPNVRVGEARLEGLRIAYGGDGAIRVGETVELAAEIEPEGVPGTVRWSASSDAVAISSAEGGAVAVTGVQNTGAGTVTITAAAGNGRVVMDQLQFKVAPGSIADRLGGVALSNTAPRYGDTVRAEHADAPAGAALTYRWYRDGRLITGAEGAEYTIGAEDIGKAIGVELSADGNFIGSISSAATSPAARAEADAPALRAEEVSDTSISIAAVDAPAGAPVYYAVTQGDAPAPGEEGAWREGRLFEGLREDTEYCIWAYTGQTDTHAASEAGWARVRTARSVRKLTLTAAAGGRAYADRDTIRTGDIVTLFAEPQNDYVFTGWESDCAAIGGSASRSVAFAMPAEDVAARAVFAKKPQVEGSWRCVNGICGQQEYRPGVKVEELIWFEPHAPEDALGAAPEYRYFRDGEEVSGGEAAVPGSYAARAVYASAPESGFSATEEDSGPLLAIVEATPDPPELSGLTVWSDAISFTLDRAASYAVLPEGQEPALTDGCWRAAAPGPVRAEGLEPDTQYVIRAYVPAAGSGYAAASPVVELAARTAHSYGLAGMPASLSFFARTGGAAPEEQSFTLRNTGTGSIRIEGVSLSGDGGAFAVRPASALLPAGGEAVFKVSAAEGLAHGGPALYESMLSFSATAESGGEYRVEPIPLTLTVQDKVRVYISIESSPDRQYDGRPWEGASCRGAAAEGGGFEESMLELFYTGTGADGRPYRSPDPPVNAGRYTVTARVREDNEHYMGEGSASFEITRRELTVSGLEAVPKVYDGDNSVALAGGALAGVVEGDDVTAAMPRAGAFADGNAGTGKAVAIGEIALSGEDAANYALVQPSLTGEIAPLPLEFSVTYASGKEYDGTAGADGIGIELTAVNIPDGGDPVSFAVSGSSYAGKDAGAHTVALGAVVVMGNVNGNYSIGALPKPIPDVPILPRAVEVAIAGPESAPYTGHACGAHTAWYPTVTGDAAKAEVVYSKGGVPGAEPVDAGSYTVAAAITDPNYEIAGIAGCTAYEITPAAPAFAGGELSFIEGGGQKAMDLSAGLAWPQGTEPPEGGEYTLEDAAWDMIEECRIGRTSGVMTVALSPGAKAGDRCRVRVNYDPKDGNYRAAWTEVAVEVGEEGYTLALIEPPAAAYYGSPAGEVFSNAALRVEFDSGRAAAEFPLDGSSGDVRHTYTPAAGPGLETVAVEYAPGGVAAACVEFNMEIYDVLEGLEVSKQPAKLEYSWGADTAYELAGLQVTALMRSGAAKAVPVTEDMLSPGAGEVLHRLGAHTVTVAYTEGGVTKTAGFHIAVRQEPAPFTRAPGLGEAGVVGGGDGIAGGDQAQPPELHFDPGHMTPGAAAMLEAQGMTDPCRQAVSVAIAGGALTKGKALEIQIPYPPGMGANDEYLAILPDGTAVLPARHSYGLRISVPGNGSGDLGDIAIGWRKAAAPRLAGGGHGGAGGYGGESAPDGQRLFWEQVENSIRNAPAGSVVRVDAGNYDRMSAHAMLALHRAVDVRLYVAWNGGGDIAIRGAEAFRPENMREYYPLALLELWFGGDGGGDDAAEGRGRAIKVAAAPAAALTAATPADQGMAKLAARPAARPAEPGPMPLGAVVVTAEAGGDGGAALCLSAGAALGGACIAAWEPRRRRRAREGGTDA